MKEACSNIPLLRSGNPECQVFHGSVPLIHVFGNTVLRTHASRSFVGGARPQDFRQFPEVSWPSRFQTSRDDTRTELGSYPILWVEPQIPGRSLAALPPLSLTYFGAAEDPDRVRDLLLCAIGIGKKTSRGCGTIDRIEEPVLLDRDESLFRDGRVMRPLPELVAQSIGAPLEPITEGSFYPPYGFTPSARCVMPPILPILREELP